MDFLTLVGYFIAALAIAYGLYLILRKNVVPDHHTEEVGATTQDNIALDADNEARIPVIPRHSRNQLVAEPAQFEPDDDLLAQTAHIKPASAHDLLDDEPNEGFGHETGSQLNPASAPKDQAATQTAPSQTTNSPITPDDPQNELLVQQGSHMVESSKPDQEPAEDMFDQALAQLEAATAPEQDQHLVARDRSDEQEIPATEQPDIQADDVVKQTAHVEDWQGESALLDAHLEDQERRDDESALAQAEHIIALYVMPAASRALSGERTIQLLRKFGLRYGEMSLFHRFLDSDGTGPLMFSVLRYTSEGPLGFDLEALPNEQVEGLAFFLALPSKHASAGYDMMVSISTLLAREIQGQVYDEYMNELSPQLREHYRHFVLDYRTPD